MNRGFVFLPIIILALLVTLGGGYVVYRSQQATPPEIKQESRLMPNLDFGSDVDTQPTPTPPSDKQEKPKATSSPKPTSSPTSIPTAPLAREITVSGFAYEDRTDDGIFNSNDPKLPNMQFYIYDTYDPNTQVHTIYSDSSGNFSVTLKVKKGMIVKPTTYNDFSPKGGQRGFGTDISGVEFGFRSVSAPKVGNVGIIEGDVFHDANRNGIMDSGEQSTYFYKLYLKNSGGNYYDNTDENAQATGSGGHFKFINLPVDGNGTYTLLLSTDPTLYEVSRTEYTYALSSVRTEYRDLKIPIYRLQWW